MSAARVGLFVILITIAFGCSMSACPFRVESPDGGIVLPIPDGSLPLPDERALWQSLGALYAQCITSHSTAECRANVQKQEWGVISAGTATTQELHGVIAPGGSKYSSPERAPEGDFCLSHDDIDWNFNVTPDPAYASLLQSANMVGDVDHPAGVIEAEWESMYLDPSYVAKAPDGGTTYETWGSPVVDMLAGDRVALRGGGVLDQGHAPYRSELHPPYLLLWGGARGTASVVYARATARLTRPSDFQTLPDPPPASEALAGDFPLPPLPDGGADGGALSLQIGTRVDWFYDSPQIVIDQSCDLANGVNLIDRTGPTFDAALASPAAHLVGTNQPSLAPGFFTVTATQQGASVHVTLTPLQRPRQAVFGATVTATWACATDGGC
jgi:hypothetical protein